MTNLNILVKRCDNRGFTHDKFYHVVQLRDNYIPAASCPDLADDPRPNWINVPLGGEVWDPTARNAVGGIGASVEIPNIDGIRHAVAQMLIAWGQMPVHDNTGLLVQWVSAPACTP